MPEHQDVEVTFERGQALSAGDLEQLPPGYGRYLSGWMPSQRGLIPRQPWIPVPLDNSPTPARGRGFYAGFRSTGMRRPLAAAWVGPDRFGTGANLRIYEVPTSATDHVTDWGGSLTTIETIDMSIAEEASHYPVVFAAGKEHVVYTNPGFPGAAFLELRPRKWDGSTVTTIAENLAARTVCYHQNRWFLGGAEVGDTSFVPTPGAASRIWFSEEEDPDTWNVTTNFIPVRSRDGDPVEAFASWESFLIIGKRDSMHYLYGSGPTTWGIREMTDAVGSASGQTAILATPRGLCFVGSDGYVYRWNGGGKPQRLTQHVLGVSKVYSYTIGETFVVPTDPAGLAYIEPILYAWVPGTRGVLCIDLDQGIEWYEELASERGALYDLTSVDDALVMTMRESDVDSLIHYRVPPYTASESNASLSGTPRPDPWGTVFRWTSGAIFPAMLNGRTTAKNVYIRYSQWHDGTGGNGLTCVLTNELGESVTKVIGKNPGVLDGRRWYWDRWDTKLDGNVFTLDIYSETADDGFSDVYTVERAVARCIGDVEPR